MSAEPPALPLEQPRLLIRDELPRECCAVLVAMCERRDVSRSVLVALHEEVVAAVVVLVVEVVAACVVLVVACAVLVVEVVAACVVLVARCADLAVALEDALVDAFAVFAVFAVCLAVFAAAARPPLDFSDASPGDAAAEPARPSSVARADVFVVFGASEFALLAADAAAAVSAFVLPAWRRARLVAAAAEPERLPSALLVAATALPLLRPPALRPPALRPFLLRRRLSPFRDPADAGHAAELVVT